MVCHNSFYGFSSVCHEIKTSGQVCEDLSKEACITLLGIYMKVQKLWSTIFHFE
jgi:hypothetical protein